jgi:hypothetical protein
MNQQPHKLLRPLANQKGMALATTFLLLLVLTLLVAVSTQWTATDIKRAADYNRSREAFFIADAGIQDAINHLNYNSFGVSPGAAANHFVDALTNWPVKYADGVQDPGGNGSYTVTIVDNHDDGDGLTNADRDYTVIATSTATTDKGKTAVIEAMLHLPRSQLDAGIIVEDDLDVSGNVTITGIEGVLIHSNDGTTIGGNVTLDGKATGEEDCEVNGGNNDPDDCQAGADFHKEIPKYFPTHYKEFAQYIMKDNGTIYDQVSDILYTQDGSDWKNPDGVVKADLAAFGFHSVQGWKANGQVYAVTDGGNIQNVPQDTILYFEHSFSVSGNVGGPGPLAWSTTIIAEKDINIGGTAYIDNCNSSSNCGNEKVIQDLFLIAGDDLKTPSLETGSIHGIFAALDQIDLGGHATITGAVISNSYCDKPDPNNEDVCDAIEYDPYDSNVVNGDDNKIHGNVTIVYNGPSGGAPTEDKVRVLTWKECTPKEINDGVATC